MKKHLFTLALAAISSVAAMAWGRPGHAAIAQIAENHLTPAAKKVVNEIMHNESIVGYASFADDFRADPCIMVDYSAEAGRPASKLTELPHTYEVDANDRPQMKLWDGKRRIQNAPHFIEKFANELKDWKNMDTQQRWYNLVLIVHYVGDIHCPGHVRYNPKEMSGGHFTVTCLGNQTTYHHVLDGELLTVLFPWSFSDNAKLFDSCTDAEIEEIVKGDVYDWGENIAKTVWPIHNVKKGDVITVKWLRDQQPLVRKQIRNAGYRLAHLINMTFDKKYAKKHQKK